MKLRLNKLKAIGPNVPSAEIEFGDGLTVISGASNTGKSYIAQCLYYMLGGQNPPKPVEGDGPYHTLLLEISAENNAQLSPFTLRRGLKTGGEIALHEYSIDSWTPDGVHRVIAWKHSPNNEANLSRLLLQLCGIDGTMLQYRANATRMISFSDLKRFIIINETTIIDDSSPVYPSRQRQDKPLEKATFDFLISGQDATGVVVRPDIKVEKAKWHAQFELIDQLIIDATAQLTSMSPLDATQLANIEARVEEILSMIDQHTGEIEDLNNTRRREWAILKAQQARFETVQQLLIRFDLLKDHYTSDLARLTFVAEGEFLLSQLSEVKCPLCQSLMSVSIDDTVPVATRVKTIQQSCLAERHKIERSITDLEITTSGLIAEQEQLANEIMAVQIRIRDAERAINVELQPAIAASHRELDELNKVRQQNVLAKSLGARLQSLQDMKKALGPEPKRTRTAASTSGTNMQQKADVPFVMKCRDYSLLGITPMLASQNSMNKWTSLSTVPVAMGRGRAIGLFFTLLLRMR
jgi:hypothetical protein